MMACTYHAHIIHSIVVVRCVVIYAYLCVMRDVTKVVARRHQERYAYVSEACRERKGGGPCRPYKSSDYAYDICNLSVRNNCNIPFGSVPKTCR